MISSFEGKNRVVRLAAPCVQCLHIKITLAHKFLIFIRLAISDLAWAMFFMGELNSLPNHLLIVNRSLILKSLNKAISS
jgi:hypothetical protein